MPQTNESEDEVMEQLRALNYIDPGDGNSIIQFFLGVFFRVSNACRAFLKKIGGALGFTKTEKGE